MDDVLDTYERPLDPKIPVLCLDEKNVVLRDDVRAPVVLKSGTRRDHEYIRCGTANIFMISEPKGGRHYARVTKRRTRLDFAKTMKWITSRYPDAITIHIVMDNLNTHNETSLIKAFGVEEGSRIWNRFHVHYTPKHASWLNQAEIAIGVMERCSLGKDRFSSIKDLSDRVLPFWKKRRREQWKIDWRFTKKKAKHWLNTFKSEH